MYIYIYIHINKYIHICTYMYRYISQIPWETAANSFLYNYKVSPGISLWEKIDLPCFCPAKS